MAQYKKGYAFFTNGSNTITSSGGAIWDGSIIRSGISVLTLEQNIGYYYINSAEGPDENNNYTIELSAPYNVFDRISCTGYQRYAITYSFTPNLGLPLIERGDINAAANFSAALYKLDQIYHDIQLTGAAYIDPLLDALDSKIDDNYDILSLKISQVSGLINSYNYSDQIIDSGEYLLNYIDSLIGNLSGYSYTNISYLNNQINYLSSSLTGINNQINDIQTNLLDSGEFKNILESYCLNLIETASGELDASIYGQIQYITGQSASNFENIERDILNLESWQTSVINENYSYKISYNSGLLSQRIVDTGSYLFNQFLDLSGIVNTLSITGSNISYGTTNSSFYIGNNISSRVLLKNDAGVLQIRNGTDSTFNNIELNSIYLNNSIIFNDLYSLEQQNGYLYFNGNALATQDWSSGIYQGFESRLEILESGSEVFFNHEFSTYGQSTYEITYGKTFPVIPRVFTQLCGNGSDPVLSYYVHSETSSSFYVTFSDNLPSNNYSLNVWAKG